MRPRSAVPFPAPVPLGWELEEFGMVMVGSGRTTEELLLGLLSVAPVVPTSGRRQPVSRLAVSKNTIAMMLSFFMFFLLT